MHRCATLHQEVSYVGSEDQTRVLILAMQALYWLRSLLSLEFLLSIKGCLVGLASPPAEWHGIRLFCIQAASSEVPGDIPFPV